MSCGISLLPCSGYIVDWLEQVRAATEPGKLLQVSIKSAPKVVLAVRTVSVFFI